jgi:cyclase
MLKTRVIPVLLLKNNGLVKSVKFKHHKYVGDPINAVKIYNEKEVDELLIIDIDASREGRGPNFELITDIGREAFMPFGYGGGIRHLDDIKKLMQLGVEKVSINSFALLQPDFLTKAAALCGSQSIVAAIDVKKDLFGNHKVYDYLQGKTLKLSPWDYAQTVEALGAGEILLSSVDRDGTYTGFDLDLIKKVATAVRIPVIALGGAAEVNDLARAIKEGKAAAVAAGSLFVFYGPHHAVLINYPEKKVLKDILG